MRKLASIQKVSEVLPIPGADAIELVMINGWQAVTKKGEYFVGDLVCYCEIDSWIPNELAPFLSKGKEPREYNGVKGERLRTIKLRGALSQGLVLPIDVVQCKTGVNSDIQFQEDDDVTELLGIQKWEPFIPPQLQGKIRGNFPSYGFKTDQERIQNCYKKVNLDDIYEVTEKMEGSSMSIINFNGEQHVCSRNLSLKLEDTENAFVKMALQLKILDALREFGRNIQISGELCGPGIQGNINRFQEPHFFVYEVYDLDQGVKVSSLERKGILAQLSELGSALEEVPHFTFMSLDGRSLKEILEMAEGSCFHNEDHEREGIVFKSTTNPEVSFKAISNKYLLGED